MSHSTKKDKILDPIYKLVGEIKNKGDEEVTFVKIIGTFYDKDGIVIGTDYTYTDPTDIKPGRTCTLFTDIRVWRLNQRQRYIKSFLQFGMELRYRMFGRADRLGFFNASKVSII